MIRKMFLRSLRRPPLLLTTTPVRRLRTASLTALSSAGSSKSPEPLSSTTTDLPPTDWSLYRTLFSTSATSPYTEYHSLAALGYDGAFETFLKCHPIQKHWKLANRVLGKSPSHCPEERAKRAMRYREELYLAHLMDRLNEPDHSQNGKPGFAGGNYAEWKKWLGESRASGDFDKVSDGKRHTSRDPTKSDWGIHTLLPPSAEEPGHRYLTIRRQSDKSKQVCVVRAVRLSSRSPSHGSLRVNLDVAGWPVGVPVSFCIWFDKDKNVLKFTDRDGTDVFRSMTVREMVFGGEMGALLGLGITQGLIDPKEVKAGNASWNLHFACDTLDLATLIARDAVIRTYHDHAKITSRRRWRWRFQEPEQCLKSPGPEAENRPQSRSPNSTIMQTDQDPSPLSEATSTGPASSPGAGAKQTQVQDVVVKRKIYMPSNGSHEIIFQLSIADDAVFRRSQKETPEANPWIVDVDVIPYITSRGSVPQPASASPHSSAPASSNAKAWPYLIDVVRPLLWPPSPQDLPAQDQAKTSGDFVPSQSPQSLRFFLPHPHLRRDLLLGAKGYSRASTVGAAYTGEEVRKRWPILFEWAKARGWWQEIESLKTSGTPPEKVAAVKVSKQAASKTKKTRVAESNH